jgi:hypothetical protein
MARRAAAAARATSDLVMASLPIVVRLPAPTLGKIGSSLAARSGCRSIHAAPLCGAGREGAATIIAPYQGCPGCQESHRGRFGKSAQFCPLAGAQGRTAPIESAEDLAQKLPPILRAERLVEAYGTPDSTGRWQPFLGRCP